MELSAAFVAASLARSYPVALRDENGYFQDLRHFRRFPDLPMFKSARLWARKRPSAMGEEILPVIAASSGFTGEQGVKARAIVWVGVSEPPLGVYAIWVSAKARAVDVLDVILDLFERFNDWNAKVRDALLERRPIPEVVKLLADATDNPFWYSDPALRVLQISDDRSLSQFSEKWSYQMETGRYPINVISNIVSSGDLDRMSKRSRAWLFDDSESYTIPFVTKTVFLNGSVYGYLFIIELNPSSVICDIEIAESLGNLIATYVQHAKFGISGSKRFSDQMLRACLAGNDVSDDERSELLDILHWNNVPGFVVVAFDRGKERNQDVEAPQVQVELLRESVGFGHVFAYDVYIVLVTDTATHSASELEERIAETCRTFGWKAGVSDEFADFATIDDHYGQSQIALQKGMSLDPGEAMFPYRRYSLAYICQKLSLGVERELLMHPDVTRLIEYDEETGSELVATLDVFLSNERNISKTAKDLYLHRNSVIYRIDKIKSIIETDLEDSGNRISLMLSLRTWGYEKLAERDFQRKEAQPSA